MAEGVVAQIKEIPGTAIGSFKTPFLAIGLIVLAVMLVLILEAFKPGLLTNPLRGFLHTVGLKSA